MMNKKGILLLAACTAFSGIHYGCGGKKSNETPSTESRRTEASGVASKQEGAAQTGIVCIWDGVPVRETPTKNGKFVSSVNLGEVIGDLNQSQIDPGDKREYIKVRLSDGKEGWAPKYGLIKNASVAAIKNDATICKRPDLLTITDIVLKPMELIAITSAKDDWVEITTEQKKKGGWIKKDAVTTNKEDVTTSIIVNKKLAAKDGKSLADKYKDIVANAPFPNSLFITNIKKQLETMESASANAAAAPDSGTAPTGGAVKADSSPQSPE
jgi:hypothetical protein